MEPWWVKKKSELASIPSQMSPVVVYDDETLNEAFFDLLCIEGLDALVYRVGLNSHPRILEKIVRLGGLLECSSPFELQTLMGLYLPVPLKQVILGEKFAEQYRKDIKNLCPTAIITVPELFPRLMAVGIHVCISIDLAHGEHGGAESGGELRRLQEAANVLADKVKAVEMVRLTGGFEGAGFKKLDFLIDFLEKVLFVFPHAKTIVLSRYLGLDKDPWTGYPDLERTASRYESLMRKFPTVRFWADPEELMIEHAGGLLTPVNNVRESQQGLVAELPVPAKFFRPPSKSSGRESVYNISKDRLIYLDWSFGGQGRVSETMASFSLEGGVSKGDLLFIPRQGICGTELEGNHWNLPAYYLRARRMCAVKL